VVDELLDHRDALLRAAVRAVQHEELHRHRALFLHPGRVDFPVDLDLADELPVRRREVVGGRDEPAPGRHRGLVDDPVERELPIDEDGRRVRGEDPGGRQLERRDLLVDDRFGLVGGEHVAHRLALVDGQHGVAAGRALQDGQGRSRGRRSRTHEISSGRADELAAPTTGMAASTSGWVGIAERPSRARQDMAAATLA
jgi:hypothetical protein